MLSRMQKSATLRGLPASERKIAGAERSIALLRIASLRRGKAPPRHGIALHGHGAPKRGKGKA